MNKTKHLTKTILYYIICLVIKMFSSWKDIIITQIQVAMYVPPGSGRAEFFDRPFHGLVLNDSSARRDYIFSDGTILPTRGNDLFYLPKGSDYYVKTIAHGGCYAINFDADISDTPFLVNIKKADILKHFKNAANAWHKMDPFAFVLARSALYNIILEGLNEQSRKYVPTSRFDIIAPAEEIIHNSFTDNSLSISSLSKACNISDAYFRRIFMEKHNVSPKEYIIFLRLKYACQLLTTGEFSVMEVATLCGYSEQCHFTREFTKRVGISPSAYQKNKV